MIEPPEIDFEYYDNGEAGPPPPPIIGGFDIAALIIAIWQGLAFLNVLPSPLELLESLFTGRPRELATVDVIKWLVGQKNEAAKLWAVTLSRLLTDFDIVISDSSAGGQEVLSRARANFVNSLVEQGVTSDRASTIANQALSSAAQAGTLAIPELQTPAPTTFSLMSNQTGLQLYLEGIGQGIADFQSGTDLSQFALKYFFKYAAPKDLLQTAIGRPGPASYPSTTGTCQAGYTYNPADGNCYVTAVLPQPLAGLANCPTGYANTPGTLCIFQPQPAPAPTPTPAPAPTPTPPPPQGPVGPGNPSPVPTQPITIAPPPAPSPGGDELSDCCNSTAQYLYAIAIAIQNFTTATTGASPSTAIDPCCTAVIAAIGAIATQLQALVAGLPALAPGATPAVDLSGIITQLQALDTDLQAGNIGATANAQTIASAIAAAGDAVASAPPTDVSAIVAAINAFTQSTDVPQAFIDSLQANGYLSAATAQALGGIFHAPAGFGAEATRDHRYARDKILHGLGVDIDAGGASVSSSSNFITWLTKLIGEYLKGSDTIVAPIVEPLIKSLTAQLTPATVTTYGNIGVDPDTPVLTSFSIGITATIMSALLSYVGWDIGESATRIAELIAAAGGFEQLKDVTFGPLIREGVAKVATLQAKALMRQDGPGFDRLAHLASRGYIAPARATALAPFSGIPAEFVTPEMNAAYTSIAPRLMIPYLESGLFTTADLTAVLTEHGMSPADQARMQLLAPYIATKSQRTSLIAELENAYAAGLLDDAGLASSIQSANQNTDGVSLATLKSSWVKQIRFTKELETSYTNLFQAGVSDSVTLQSQLAGIGLQPDTVNQILAIAENKQAATLARRATAEERALIRATANVERQAALKSYADGSIDAIALAAALVLTGLTVVQAAAWADLAVAKKSGSQRWQYGLELAPTAALALRQQVTALVDQRIASLITDAQLQASLKALNLPAIWINALTATADATITSKPGATLFAVNTNQ